jgi:hypothetical protein
MARFAADLVQGVVQSPSSARGSLAAATGTSIAKKGGLSRTGIGPNPTEIADKVVIASEAKQSIVLHNGWMDCFVASAPRNDGSYS